MKALSDWDWPGNIRELANFIERAVILTRGTFLSQSCAAPGNDAKFGLMKPRQTARASRVG